MTAFPAPQQAAWATAFLILPLAALMTASKIHPVPVFKAQHQVAVVTALWTA